MKKIVLKIFVITFMIIIFSGITTYSTLTPGNINGNVSISGENELKQITGRVLGIVDTLGTVLAVAVIIIFGIQYMYSSIEQKAQYKAKLIPYVIGCIFLFATPKIANLIYKIATKIR